MLDLLGKSTTAILVHPILDHEQSARLMQIKSVFFWQPRRGFTSPISASAQVVTERK